MGYAASGKDTPNNPAGADLHNVVVFEFHHSNGQATITTVAETEDDDAIRMSLDALTEQGISHTLVTRVYSERQPHPDWIDYFTTHLPHTAITWSFAAGESATKIKTEVSKALLRTKKPWWKFWQ